MFLITARFEDLFFKFDFLVKFVHFLTVSTSQPNMLYYHKQLHAGFNSIRNLVGSIKRGQKTAF